MALRLNTSEKSEISDIRRFCVAFWELPSIVVFSIVILLNAAAFFFLTTHGESLQLSYLMPFLTENAKEAVGEVVGFIPPRPRHAEQCCSVGGVQEARGDHRVEYH